MTTPTTTTAPRLAIVAAEARQLVIEVGRNGEYADASNPGGVLYDDVLVIEALDAKGRWYRLVGFSKRTNDRDVWDRWVSDADALALRIEAAGSIDPELWAFDRISYGADGWEEQELAHEVREARDAGELHPLDR